MKKPAKSNLQKKAQRNRTILTIVVAVVFLSLLYNIGKSQYDLAKLKKQKEELTTQLETQTQHQGELTEQIEKSTDLEYIEYLAKKYLNMVYPGEKKVVVNEEK